MTKIMLVEDDNGLREIYEARLAAEGFDIVSATDGEAALALAAKEKPDLVISDVMMPKISGFEMLDILRNTEGLKNVKIIMLTALGQAEDKTRAEALGADRYLVKSQVTLEDIVKSTHDLLDPLSGASNVTATTPLTEPVPAQPAAEQVPVAMPEPTVQTIAVASAPGTAPATVQPTPVAAEPVAPAALAQPTPPSVPEAPAIVAVPVGVPPAPVDALPAPADIQPAAPESEARALGGITAVEIPPEAPTIDAAPVPASPPPAPELNAAGYEPQTLAEEEAIMQAQIDNFVGTPAETPSGEPAPAPESLPVQPVTTPETVPATTPAPAATETQETTFSPMAAPNPDEGSAAEETANPDTPGSAVAHKKVISPLSTSPKPDINALLAIEEAKEAAAVAPVAPPAPPVPPATPGVDPSSIAL
jgi:CheY-like chemotaxis protein